MANSNLSFRKLVRDKNAAELDEFLHLNFKNIDINELMANKSTALHLATSSRNIDLAKVLIEHGAKFDVRDENGENCLELAARLGEHDIVNMCLQCIGDICHLQYPIKDAARVKDIGLRKCLNRKLWHYNVYDICKFLLDHKADVNHRVCHGRLTPMLSILREKGAAAYESGLDISLIKLLLEYGADPNAEDDEGHSTFYLCFALEDADLINCLIDHGANITSDDYRKGALYMAVTYGMHEIVKKLIEMNVDVTKFQINPPHTYHITPLHALYLNTQQKDVDSERRLATMRILIEQGVDVNEANSDNETPLYSAACMGCLEGARYLVRMGSDVNGRERNRPIFAAVIRTDEDMVNFLISHGANIDIKSEYGKSVLQYAAREIRHDYNSFPFSPVRFNERTRDEQSCIFLMKDPSSLWDFVSFLMERGAVLCDDDRDGIDKWNFYLFMNHQREFNRMKETKLCKEGTTTYFDLLTKRGNSLVNCLRSNEVMIAIKSCKHKELFARFASRLERNYFRGMERMALVDESRKILSQVFQGLFPLEVTDLITDFLSSEELEHILRR